MKKNPFKYNQTVPDNQTNLNHNTNPIFDYLPDLQNSATISDMSLSHDSGTLVNSLELSPYNDNHPYVISPLSLNQSSHSPTVVIDSHYPGGPSQFGHSLSNSLFHVDATLPYLMNILAFIKLTTFLYMY